RGDVARFFDRLGNLYAAALAASASVNLRFDDDAACARVEQGFGSDFGLLAVLHHLAARHGNTILFQNRLGLILVNFHWILYRDLFSSKLFSPRIKVVPFLKFFIPE